MAFQMRSSMVFILPEKNKLEIVPKLAFTSLGANSADHKLVTFSYMMWHFMQLVSTGDNLHEMSDPVFWEK